MSKNGGYKIIDFKDINLPLSTGILIDGIYDHIENNHRKTYLLSGLTLGGTQYPDIFTTPTVSSGNYVFSSVYGEDLTVAPNDYVRWGAASSEEEPE